MFFPVKLNDQKFFFKFKFLNNTFFSFYPYQNKKIYYKKLVFILYIDIKYTLRYFLGTVVSEKKKKHCYKLVVFSKKTKTFLSFFLNNPSILQVKIIH